jgi:DNA-binding response OmpR family regulator
MDILIIEDNNQLRKYLKEYLQAYGFVPHFLNEYDKLPEAIAEISPKLILLDITLPMYDGFYFLRVIRKHCKIPVIILSARSDEADQIRGIEGGAHDYITKPFSAGVLIAKINALLARESTTEEILRVGEIVLSKNAMTLSRGEKTVELSKNEFKMLALLLERAGQYVSREEMLEALWDDATFVDDNTLTVNISRVKKRLVEVGLNDGIVTKRGVGYAFMADN